MKSAAKSRIGENPLDALVGSTPAKKAPPLKVKIVPEESPKRAAKKMRATFHISVELFDQVRDAVVACSGPPLRLTLASFAEQALRNELERLTKEANKGKRFPRRESELRGGRPMSA